MRYVIMFAILLIAGCTSEVTEDTEEDVLANNESLEQETAVDSTEPGAETEDTIVDVEEPEVETEDTIVDKSGTITTGSFAQCLQRCSGGAGSGAYCEDGCRFEQAENTKDTSYCDELDQKESIPECYGTVAIAAGDIKICDKLTNTEDYNHCIATFLPR